jgi:hypothetical protein
VTRDSHGTGEGRDTLHAALRRRPLIVSPDGENRQERTLKRVGECAGLYVGENRSEAATLANLHKRGWLDRERVGGRWCYRLRVEPLDSDQQELIA